MCPEAAQLERTVHQRRSIAADDDRVGAARQRGDVTRLPDDD